MIQEKLMVNTSFRMFGIEYISLYGTVAPGGLPMPFVLHALSVVVAKGLSLCCSQRSDDRCNSDSTHDST